MSSGRVIFCTAWITLMAAGCGAPRAPAGARPCTVNSQCPADGKHYCDLSEGEIGVCKPCFGQCPIDQGAADGGDDAFVSDTTAGSDADVAAVDVPAKATSTCVGWCGKDVPVPGTDCFCDGACVLGEDCCADFKAACPGLVPPDAVTSCVGSCGSPDPVETGGCYCDLKCQTNNDCCADYVAVCGDPDAGASDTMSADTASADTASADTGADAGSADAGGEDIQPGGESCYGWCGQGTPPKGSTTLCMCNAACVANKICCKDYEKYCAPPDAGGADAVDASADATGTKT